MSIAHSFNGYFFHPSQVGPAFFPPAVCSLFLLLFLLLPDLKLHHPQVNLAYEAVKEVDDLGSEAWEVAMERYDERIDWVETRITARLG